MNLLIRLSAYACPIPKFAATPTRALVIVAALIFIAAVAVVMVQDATVSALETALAADAFAPSIAHGVRA